MGVCLGMTIFLCEAKANDVDLISALAGANQEIVTFDTTAFLSEGQ